MRTILSAIFLVFPAALAFANDLPLADRPFLSEQVPLADLQWAYRPIVVFADTPNDPRFIQQMELLNRRPEALIERDVVVMTDSDRDSGSALREKLRPRGFMLAIIGKDGRVELRKPAPWDVREITRAIDKMPLRQQEIRDAQRSPQG